MQTETSDYVCVVCPAPHVRWHLSHSRRGGGRSGPSFSTGDAWLPSRCLCEKAAASMDSGVLMERRKGDLDWFPRCHEGFSGRHRGVHAEARTAPAALNATTILTATCFVSAVKQCVSQHARFTEKPLPNAHLCTCSSGSRVLCQWHPSRTWTTPRPEAQRRRGPKQFILHQIRCTAEVCAPRCTPRLQRSKRFSACDSASNTGVVVLAISGYHIWYG